MHRDTVALVAELVMIKMSCAVDKMVRMGSDNPLAEEMDALGLSAPWNRVELAWTYE